MGSTCPKRIADASVGLWCDGVLLPGLASPRGIPTAPIDGSAYSLGVLDPPKHRDLRKQDECQTLRWARGPATDCSWGDRAVSGSSNPFEPHRSKNQTTCRTSTLLMINVRTQQRCKPQGSWGGVVGERNGRAFEGLPFPGCEGFELLPSLRLLNPMCSWHTDTAPVKPTRGRLGRGSSSVRFSSAILGEAPATARLRQAPKASPKQARQVKLCWPIDPAGGQTHTTGLIQQLRQDARPEDNRHYGRRETLTWRNSFRRGIQQESPTLKVGRLSQKPIHMYIGRWRFVAWRLEEVAGEEGAGDITGKGDRPQSAQLSFRQTLSQASGEHPRKKSSTS
jgi:hypothetical protein